MKDPTGADVEAVLVLVEGADDLAIVFGNGAIDASLGESLDLLPGPMVDLFARHTGLLSQADKAFGDRAGRWVRLTKESAAALREYGPTPDGRGAPLGVLRGPDGRFAHVTRWDAMSPMAFDPATLAAALAVQRMLKRIEVKLDDIASGVEALIRGSKIELEARLVSAMDVIRRVERRVGGRGTVDGADWSSLSAIEQDVKAAYHETVRWLEPLREFLADDDRSLVEQVKQLRRAHGIKDVSFWLRMHIHAELALKRWDLLYLMHELETAPERVSAEADLVRRAAQERHDELRALLDELDGFLSKGEGELSVVERLRVINRMRLGRLRLELAEVANAYAAALEQALVDVPEYVPGDPRAIAGPLIDLGDVADLVGEKGMAALQAGGRAATASGGAVGRSVARLRDRVTARGEEDAPQGEADGANGDAGRSDVPPQP